MPTTATFSLDAVMNEFYAAALNYSNVIRPYALHLFYALLLIELVVTFVQYTADGAIDPISYLGRMIRQLMGAGFILAMLTYGFQWMGLVLRSFAQLGSILTGLPTLSPQGIIQAGETLALVLWNSPTSTGIISGIELGITEAILIAVVFFSFLFVAVELLLTVARAYLTIGVGVILLSFGANRFTSNASEGYFSSVFRQGTKILFMYAVLAIGTDIVTHLTTALMAACTPATTAVPWITTYFTPPTAIMTTTCTGTIALSDMLNYVAVAVVFAVCVIGVPRMAAELVGGQLGHALEDLAAAYYLGRAIGRGASSMLAAPGKIARRAFGRNQGNQPSQSSMQNFAADAAAQARAKSASHPTQPLNPFNGQRPGYNMRPPSGPSAARPALPPSPNNGSGGGGAALEYYPGQPGAKTKAEAIDITKLQEK